jgi:hypothetical protein
MDIKRYYRFALSTSLILILLEEYKITPIWARSRLGMLTFQEHMTSNVIHEKDYFVPESAVSCPTLNERIPEDDPVKNRERRVPKGRKITTKELIP